MREVENKDIPPSAELEQTQSIHGSKSPWPQDPWYRRFIARGFLSSLPTYPPLRFHASAGPLFPVMALSYSQCKKMRATVPALNARGEEIMAAFYQNLLRGHPELRSYFNTANQQNKLQPRAMASLITQFANNVNHIYELIPKTERICQKHCSVGVQPHHYKVMGTYLLEAFTGILDPSMTPDAKMAWRNAYWMLANMFIAREEAAVQDVWVLDGLAAVRYSRFYRQMMR
ncbi:hypothetical protein ED733_002655 [Metarhizium rileyi]|uniref:Globin domain-containing protein n=1 Tax=Metarhizium rileyi (strain RCEF 4871) TaxID=1649241 RepID=A0A5C6G598_METRR|nr:hypothetical protein ED733_002655 [Metarhizium rileyi]